MLLLRATRARAGAPPFEPRKGVVAAVGGLCLRQSALPPQRLGLAYPLVARAHNPRMHANSAALDERAGLAV